MNLKDLIEQNIVQEKSLSLMALVNVQNTNIPTISTKNERSRALAIMPLEVFEALLAGYTEEDLFDLRMLGNSEQYATKTEMSPKLVDLLEKAKK